MFDNVLVGVDHGEAGRAAIALAEQLAAPAARIAVEPSVGCELHLCAEQREADLIVIGARRRDLVRRALIGDDPGATLNGSPCAVAIAPPGYAARPAQLCRIGVGYDGSPESTRALAVAREIASRHGGTVEAVAVVPLQTIPYGEPIGHHLPHAAKHLLHPEHRRRLNLGDVEGDVTYGSPGPRLATFSERLDLLVVGSRNQGPIGRLINGSTSNHLLRRVRCPLLVLPRTRVPDVDHQLVEADAQVAVGS